MTQALIGVVLLIAATVWQDVLFNRRIAALREENRALRLRLSVGVESFPISSRPFSTSTSAGVRRGSTGAGLLVFVLIGLLGWKVFGAMVQ